jgi:hypothetical protein
MYPLQQQYKKNPKNLIWKKNYFESEQHQNQKEYQLNSTGEGQAY